MSDLDMIRTLAGNNEISDEVIAFYLDSVKTFILAYCNLKVLPVELRPTLIEIVASRIRANTAGSEVTLGGGIKSVASISDGNQSISYQVGGNFKSFINNDDIISTYGSILDRFRKMVISPRPVRHVGARNLHKDRKW